MVFLLLVPLVLSFISDIILITWFTEARRLRPIIRRGTMLKEYFLFFAHMLVTIMTTLMCIFQWLLTTSESESTILVVVGALMAQTLLALFPLCMFAYLRYSLRTSPRESRQEVNVDRHDFQTAGLQTAPPSTRVSLPSDTAEHAPNFLSPSTAEPTDVTPLLN